MPFSKKVKVKNKHRIGIFMWYNDKIKDYADINYKINKLYCDKHGYDLKKCNIRRVSKRLMHFERYPLLCENIDNYDYVMWVDADAHFLIDSPPIESFINLYPEKIFILSNDVGVKSKYEEYYNINSGVFIVKNDNLSKFILKQVYSNDELWEKKQNYIKRFQDQGVLVYLYDHNLYNFRDISIILPKGVLQAFGGTNELRDILQNKVKDERVLSYHKTLKHNLPYIIHYLSGTRDTIRVSAPTGYLKYIEKDTDTDIESETTLLYKLNYPKN